MVAHRLSGLFDGPCPCQGAGEPAPGRLRASAVQGPPPSPGRKLRVHPPTSYVVLHPPRSAPGFSPCLWLARLVARLTKRHDGLHCTQLPPNRTVTVTPRKAMQGAFSAGASSGTSSPAGLFSMLQLSCLHFIYQLEVSAGGWELPAPTTHGGHSASLCPGQVAEKWQRSGREVAEKWQRSGREVAGPQIPTDSHRIGLERREGAVLTNRLHQAARPEQLGLAQVCHQGLQPLEHPATSWHIPAKSRLLHVRSIPDASRSTGTGLLHALHGRVALHGQERLLEWKTCALNLLKQRTEVLIRMILLDCVTHQHLH